MTKQSLLAQAQPELYVKGALSHSPLQLSLIVAFSIMTIEAVLMFIFALLPQMSPAVENIADGILLAILLSPILFQFLFRPLCAQISALAQAEKLLRHLNEELTEKSMQLIAAQEELVRKERLAMLGQVAENVGHELRTPLAVMNNAVYFLQTLLSDADETTNEYLNIIKGEIAASERIVSDLMDSVRIPPPHLAIVGVQELIEQTLPRCGMPATVTLKLDIPATLSPLRVDAMQIHQVFRNLISNGIEAMPNGGALEICAAEDVPAKTITISVRDNGSGMGPEQLGKLFQPLFTTKARGMGLGLVMVKNLTEANGGTVKVESEAGKGCVFSVMLPAANVGRDLSRHVGLKPDMQTGK